jgi:uncharacterized protein YbjT (DUF2867 family)
MPLLKIKIMQPLTAVVLGATGLIGEQLVKQLLHDPAFSKIRILVRRPVQFSDSKLEVVVVNFDDPADYQNKLGHGDCIFSCIGTTNKKVKGDKLAYRKIDFDIPVQAAKTGRLNGFTTFLLVSSVGANAASANFYLKLKGEVEREIAAIHFQSFQVFRPGILYGARKEQRPGELVGKALMKFIDLLLYRGVKKYRGIEASAVAKAMVGAAKSGPTGTYIHHFTEIVELASAH